MSEVLNTGAIVLKKIMIDKHISVKELSEILQKTGYNIEPRVLSNKFYRDTFTLNEYVLIANALGCEIKAISKNGNIEYTIECNSSKEKDKRNSTSIIMKELANKKKDKGGKN